MSKNFWLSIIIIGFIFVLAFSPAEILSHEGEEHEAVSAGQLIPTNTLTTESAITRSRQDEEIIQKTCPVMVGNEIDPNIYSIYKGKKVYFCCEICKRTFENNPEEYLSNLPQFSSEEVHEHEKQESSAAGFAMWRLIKPVGIVTIILLLMTASCGYFMPKNRKLLYRWHRRLAYATVIFAICHAALILFFH